MSTCRGRCRRGARAHRAALLEHHVVVFPGQTLTREQQYAFTAQLGEVEAHGGGAARQAAGCGARHRQSRRRRQSERPLCQGRQLPLAHRQALLRGAPGADDALRGRIAARGRRHRIRQHARSPTTRCPRRPSGGSPGCASCSSGSAGGGPAITPTNCRRSITRWCALIPRPAARRSISAITPMRILGLPEEEGAALLGELAGARDAAAIRLRAPLAGGRSGRVGQPLPAASRGRQLRDDPVPPHHAPQRRQGNGAGVSEAGDILFDVRGRLGVVTLNRPQALNAFTLDMYRRLDPCCANGRPIPRLRRWRSRAPATALSAPAATSARSTKPERGSGRTRTCPPSSSARNTG